MAKTLLNYCKFIFKVSLTFEPKIQQLRIYLRNTLGQNYKIALLNNEHFNFVLGSGKLETVLRLLACVWLQVMKYLTKVD